MGGSGQAGAAAKLAHLWAVGRWAVAVVARLGPWPAAALKVLLPWGQDASAEEEAGAD